MESQNQNSNSKPINGIKGLQYSSFPSNFMKKVRANLAVHSKWTELNGAMGDLGTYVPLVLALPLAKDLNLGTTLIFTGIHNIISGTVYGVPMPVQPMKCIVAVALANGSDFRVPEIMAAGICTGGIMLLLGVTGWMQLLYKLVPFSVVSGVQLAQGLSFAMTALNYVEKIQDFRKPFKSNWEFRHWLGLDGLVLALICACFLVLVDGVRQEVIAQHEKISEGNKNDHEINVK